MQAKCPECEAQINLPKDVMPGELVSCPDCGLEFEVCSIQGDHAEIKVARVEGEDWGE
ncbi:lysine biosynthesis protein LysW [Candidatus Bathyarchaeota archaeon]|nr:lysine biosynthesis protein LysW [Candidatus Bathyarchaeota archaeon]